MYDDSSMVIGHSLMVYFEIPPSAILIPLFMDMVIISTIVYIKTHSTNSNFVRLWVHDSSNLGDPINRIGVKSVFKVKVKSSTWVKTQILAVILISPGCI